MPNNTISQKVIKFFIREESYGFLSNFERTGFSAYSWGKPHWYPTNEHYYQARKANCEEVHDWIVKAPHARLAMVIGREIEHNKYLKEKYMIPLWEEYKNDVMLKGLTAKFDAPLLAVELLCTGDAILHEDNPEDSYWGIGDGTGLSMLGKLIMQVREKLKEKHCIGNTDDRDTIIRKLFKNHVSTPKEVEN